MIRLRRHAFFGTPGKAVPLAILLVFILSAPSGCRGPQGSGPTPGPAGRDAPGETAVHADVAIAGLDGAPRYVAGEQGLDLAIRITAGAGGLPQGTIIRITLPGERWSEPQIGDGEAPGYISVESAGATPDISIAAKGLGRVPSRTRAVVSLILAGDLGPTESLAVRYAGPKAQETAGEALIPVQLKRPSDPEPLDMETLRVVVAAGPAVWTRILAPSDAIAGRPFKVRLRPLDRFGNLAQAPAGVHTLELVRPGNTTGREIEISPGEIEWVADAAGTGTFMLFDKDGGVRGIGDPMQVASAPQRWRREWADLHFHTGLSDAYVPVSPEAAFAYGRDASGLDLACLTDHAEGIWGDPLTNREFDEIVGAAQRASGPDFLALAGFEWTGTFFWDPEYPEGPGHMNVVPLAEPVRPCRADLPECDDPVELFARLEPARAVAVWHHSLVNWGAADMTSVPMPELIVPLAEIFSTHGSSECVECPPKMRDSTGEARHTVQAALVSGRRVGFTGSSDNHMGHPGANEFPGYVGLPLDAGGLTCVLVEGTGLDAYGEALRSRRTYATTGIRPLVDFSIMGRPMGSAVTSPGPPSFDISVTFNEPIASIEIVKGWAGAPLPLEAVHTARPNATSAAFSWTDDHFDGPAFYYVRAYDAHGEAAWTSPIWVEPIAPSGGEESRAK